MCQHGHRVVRDVFERVESDRLRGFVVFLPMLGSDTMAAAVAQASELSDPRVVQLWDPERVMGGLSASTLGLRSTAWDVYLVYQTGVTWDVEALPPPMFWMHQLPLEVGAPQSLRLDSDALALAVRRAVTPGAEP